MIVDWQLRAVAPPSHGTRKRGYLVDTMVAFAAAAALTFLYVTVLGWATKETLVPWTFAPLPVGAILPSGWILGEMQIMANGLAGHQHDFYIYVNDSRWLYPQGTGGIDYSTVNEALPYWFNGLVPLAYLLDDTRLKNQVHSVATTVLVLQTDDGWIGPEVLEERNFWGRVPFFLGLTQLAEANSTWEKPVVGALRRFMHLTNQMLRNHGQGHLICPADVVCSWGQTRVHDLIITIQWMLEKHPSAQDALLWDNMDLFYEQSLFKWVDWYQPGVYLEVVSNPSLKHPDYPYLHGVNVGQGLKAAAVVRRFKHNESLVDASMRAVNWTFLYHGAPSGTILGDEIQRDLAPYMGSELCTAVETGYSLAYMYLALGTNYYADRAELVIYNAMPVMMTDDMWAHQYMDQPNGPWATNNTQDFTHPHGPFLFTTAHSGAATTFGLEPQYPCCTVNHPQGYPKFVTHSWGRAGNNGLAHTLLGPSKVSTELAEIKCDTAYPFDHTLKYTVTSSQGVDLFVRVPSWHDPKTSTIGIGGSSFALKPDPATGMHKISVPPGLATITYTIGASIRSEPRANNTVAVYFGNLLYALDVGLSVKSSFPHPFNNAGGSGINNLPYPQARDYYINNTKAWNVAIDPSTLAYKGIGDSSSLPTPVFEYGAPPNFMTVRGCEIAWGLHLGATPDLVPEDRTCLGEVSTYKLIPYGSAKVHMSELPIVRLS
ncbi:hypothetical protein B0T22DRAFT_527713 [Podospora appendiculata]|uniref:Uncharacterized protein n=1 Tax=Podospora appendiculata TaxID=314037 RepID=A0AAE1CC31_9PEZI|nr:hypothetical protein B0T22DRAFT_527713 [Podospora appendiculata]